MKLATFHHLFSESPPWLKADTDEMAHFPSELIL